MTARQVEQAGDCEWMTRACLPDFTCGVPRQLAKRSGTRAAAKICVFVNLLVGTQILSAAAFAAVGSLSGFPAGYGVSFRDSPTAPEIVVIPPGFGVVGSTDDETTPEARAPGAAAFEKPRRQASLSRAPGVGKYPVTVEEYSAFADTTHHASTGGCTVLEGGKWQFGADACGDTRPSRS